MDKKLKWLAVIAVIAVIVASGYALFGRTKSASPQTQQQAINDGLEYLEENNTQGCGDALTPAIHTKTGAKHTFSSTCIPPGWEAER